MKGTAEARTSLNPITILSRLTVEDLKDLPVPVTISNGLLVIEKGPRGWTLKEPVRVSLEAVLAVREKGLVSYILRAFLSERPRLIPWVFANQSLVRLARHFLRH